MKARNPSLESRRLNMAERHLFMARTLAGEHFTANDRVLPPVRPDSAPGWMMWASQICDYGGKLTGVPLAFELDLDENGTVAAVPVIHRRGGPSFDDWSLHVGLRNHFAQLFPALLALSLVNGGHAKIKRQILRPS